MTLTSWIGVADPKIIHMPQPLTCCLEHCRPEFWCAHTPTWFSVCGGSLIRGTREKNGEVVWSRLKILFSLESCMAWAVLLLNPRPERFAYVRVTKTARFLPVRGGRLWNRLVERSVARVERSYKLVVWIQKKGFTTFLMFACGSVQATSNRDGTADCPELALVPIINGNQIAIVASGWFWGPQLRFKRWVLKPVAKTVKHYSCLEVGRSKGWRIISLYLRLCVFSINGVARCKVGYCGGVESDPTYDNMKDFTESVFLEFDPNVVTYEDVLKQVRDLDPEGSDMEHPWLTQFFRRYNDIISGRPWIIHT